MKALIVRCRLWFVLLCDRQVYRSIGVRMRKWQHKRKQLQRRRDISRPRSRYSIMFILIITMIDGSDSDNASVIEYSKIEKVTRRKLDVAAYATEKSAHPVRTMLWHGQQCIAQHCTVHKQIVQSISMARMHKSIQSISLQRMHKSKRVHITVHCSTQALHTNAA